MFGWFERTIVDTGRLPLFCLFAGLIVGFAVIRFSVRMIRAQVRWWPGNVKSGGLHIHHMVFGVILMILAGMGAFAFPDEELAPNAVLGALFGIGTALVLDEFALILHLRDVYWAESGRISVDAIFVAASLAGLTLLGFTPIGVSEAQSVWAHTNVATVAAAIGALVVNLGMAVLTLLKGKIWTGLFGFFFFPLLLIGSIRLGRPRSPWARWRYKPGSRRLKRARRRERRLRRPMVRAKIKFQELISGRPDAPTD